MSDQTQQTTSVQPTATAPSGVPAATTPTSPSGQPAASMSTSIGSLEDLKNSAPQVYQAMMVGLAMTICNQMQAAQARLKALQQEYNEELNRN